MTEWLAGLAVLALAGLAVWVFNQLVRDRNQVSAAWSDIDVQLQRRHDLVPNLVSTVKAYAAHERETLERVVAERNASRKARGVGERARHEGALEQSLTGLVALAEAYPDLKASENFAQLSAQLSEVEDHLQYARRFYNGSVRQYNTRIQQFPHLLLARPFGFAEAEFFGADADARRATAIAL
ncbi:MAG: rane protein [Panacagrimonas sp.]|jgi:LemA protein|nr:LemA family protein [Panacagrimonas sp.]MCC2657068.1 rane protein [Panacagrimonas sp.]